VAVTLNQRGYDNARRLIDEGAYVIDDRDVWSENAAVHLHGQLDAIRRGA
jgi:hypothetical protein